MVRENFVELLSTVFSPSLRRRLSAWLSWLLMSLVFAGGIGNARAQTDGLREYQIKAVFLFNFAQFVEWPATAFADAHSPIVIGVLGEDPFGSLLDDTIRGETVGGRPLVVQRYRRVEEIKVCHILFISTSEAGRSDSVLFSLRRRPLLTVSDLDGFAGRGGMIQLFTEKSKVRLRIDLAPAKAANLTISSKLLRPAEVISPPSP